MRREGGQVRAAEAGRRGSVGHVEVFRTDGVGTSVVGRPRRLSADRRSRPAYTLIWEEPDYQSAVAAFYRDATHLTLGRAYSEAELGVVRFHGDGIGAALFGFHRAGVVRRLD